MIRLRHQVVVEALQGIDAGDSTSWQFSEVDPDKAHRIAGSLLFEHSSGIRILIPEGGIGKEKLQAMKEKKNHGK